MRASADPAEDTKKSVLCVRCLCTLGELGASLVATIQQSGRLADPTQGLVQCQTVERNVLLAAVGQAALNRLLRQCRYPPTAEQCKELADTDAARGEDPLTGDDCAANRRWYAPGSLCGVQMPAS